MKKIIVQKRLTKHQAVVIIAFLVIGVLFLGYIAFFDDSISANSSSKIFELIAVVLSLTSLIFASAVSKKPYVEQLLLYPNHLVLVYKNSNKKFLSLELEDIKSVHATMTTTTETTGKTSYVSCDTKVVIETTAKGRIYFRENSPLSHPFCPYDFLLSLLANAKYFPNFSYEVISNNEIIKQDIENYAKTGKKLSLWEKIHSQLKKISLIVKLLIIVPVIMLFISFSFLFYNSIPVYVSETEKEYASYVEEGYKAYQKDDYNASIDFYDKAKTIINTDPALYERSAWTYYYKGDYQKAIIEAQTGIGFLNEKSTYYKVKGYKYIKNPDISLYTTLGDAFYQLKNYNEAKEAYNYVIIHSNYTYTDIYFKRGKCEYYLLQKQEALEDFSKHKEIIEKYFFDQSKTEYKDHYPRYKQKDLDNINLWIEAVFKYLK